jgi:hypothetical protein
LLSPEIVLVTAEAAFLVDASLARGAC